MNVITESEIEKISLDYLASLGYSTITGPLISPDGDKPERNYNEVILTQRLRDAVDILNPNLPLDVKEEVIKKVLRTDSPNLVLNNQTFHKYLTEGVEIEYRIDNGIKGGKCFLIDFENPLINQFVAVNQFTIIEGTKNKRPDIILFINGLPLVVIELKNAVDESATLKSSFNQLQTYKQTIPSLFTYNELMIISDGLDARCGTITSEYNRFSAWKSIDGKYTADTFTPQMEVMFKGMLNKRTLLDLIRHFIVFEKSEKTIQKKVSAYHQYYAVNKAINTTIQAASETGDNRGGVVWHTQGSGKSLSMVFYTGKLVLNLNNPTIVVLTDRNDLDNQLYETFSNCQQLIRQTPQQAEDRKHLRQLLNVASGGIVFTTIQKFLPILDQDEIAEDKPPLPSGEGRGEGLVNEPKPETYFIKNKPLSQRRNIIVIADEAHRSQYDFIDGYAKHLHDALPNATFIGFTGTPIESTDKNTRAVFGDYIDIYDIERAVEDGSTVRIYYESRLAKVNFKEDEKLKIDEKFEELTEDEEVSNKQLIKAKWARVEAIVGNEHRINKIAEDLVKHFELRSSTLEGKAMIVCMSRRICVEVYNAISKIRPTWVSDEDDKGQLKVVMTGSSSDPLDWQKHIRNKAGRKNLAERFKNPSDQLKIVIVRDMWLTGFDVPCLHTLYIDKPMQGHNLMQAIARVNRVFKDKEGGLIVDYIGIAPDLKKALADYTESGGKGEPTFDQELAVAKMLEYYEVVSQLFNGFDYKKFFTLNPEEKLKFIPVAADFIFSLDEGSERFIEQVKNLLKAFAISVPHEKAIEIRDEVAFFQAVKARISKISDSRKTRTDEEIETAIKQIISDAITSDEVVDVFDAAGIKKPNIDILDDLFLAEIKNMPLKNLAAELLRRLLKDEIRKRSKYNLVQTKKFSELLEEAINKYHNGMIDTVEFIEQFLIPLAKEIKESDKRGEVLGLDFRELAFYDALSTNESAVSVLGDETLRTIARELLDSVRKNVTIDWTIKESVQATLRRHIRRILRKYDYPPDLQEKAVQFVLDQAKLLADNLSNEQ